MAEWIESRLERSDKWFLGGGEALVWAPTFPQHLEALGFWDEAHLMNLPVEHPFAVTVLDESHHQIRFELESRRWLPSHLTQRYVAADGLILVERKACIPGDVLVSEVTIENVADRDRELHLIQWTCRRTDPERGSRWVADAHRHGQSLIVDEGVCPSIWVFKLTPSEFHLAWGADIPVVSGDVRLSAFNSDLPRWELSPFDEQMTMYGRLAGAERIGKQSEPGALYAASHYVVRVPARQRAVVNFCLSVGKDRDKVLRNLDSALERGSFVLRSVESWQEFFSSVPRFECSDPYLETAYWYRWYGLRLNMLLSADFLAKRPAVFEGIGGFRNLITYSAQCHMRECRWMRSPLVAQGTLLNFVEHQNENGSFPANVWAADMRTDGLFIANWGRAVLAVDRVHPDDKFLADVYPALCRYADFFIRERDHDHSSLYDVTWQGETGQEYMPRYLAVDEKADEWGPFLLKGVDATVYMYETLQALGVTAERLGKPDEAALWHERARKTGRAILERMWDSADEMFFDVDPRSGKPTGCKHADCFYPFVTDLIGQEHLGAIHRHLLNPDEFWTPYPVPSTSVDDPLFSAEPNWKGVRHSCPWNGRMWPMTSSHVAEALAETALRVDSSLKTVAAELIRRYIRTLFYEGDPKRPNCFEHYNPFTGKPSQFRGIDDYQHSWIVDLIVQYVAGVQPQPDGILRVEPLPFDLDWFRIEGVPYRGHTVDVSWDARKQLLKVDVDGKLHSQARGLEGMHVRFGDSPSCQ
jgi:hypothetical protein